MDNLKKLRSEPTSMGKEMQHQLIENQVAFNEQ